MAICVFAWDFTIGEFTPGSPTRADENEAMFQFALGCLRWPVHWFGMSQNSSGDLIRSAQAALNDAGFVHTSLCKVPDVFKLWPGIITNSPHSTNHSPTLFDNYLTFGHRFSNKCVTSRVMCEWGIGITTYPN